MQVSKEENATCTPPILNCSMDRAIVINTNAMETERRLEREWKNRSQKWNRAPMTEPSAKERTTSSKGSTSTERTSTLPAPMAWNEEKNFGFTSGEKPWLPFATRSGEINVEKDGKSEKSVVNYYRELFHLRQQYEAFRCGTFKSLFCGQSHFLYERTLGEERFLVVCNFEQETEIKNFALSGELLLSNYGRKGAKIDRIYAPYEAAIYKINRS